jgi:uncharacterized protein (DUF4415 family)
MANRKPWTDDEGEVRELTEEFFAEAKKFSDLPEEEQRVLRGIMEEGKRGKQTAVPIARDLVSKMQATGEGWEKRIEEAVRLWLERHAKRRKMAS